MFIPSLEKPTFSTKYVASREIPNTLLLSD